MLTRNVLSISILAFTLAALSCSYSHSESGRSDTLLDAKSAAPNPIVDAAPTRPALHGAIESAEEYHSIEFVSREVMRFCPPDSCILICVGRAPAPIEAYLSVALGESAANSYEWNLPLTNFRYGVFVHQPGLDEKEEARLRAFFKNMLPDKASIGTKKIMLLDYAPGGGTLVATRNYLLKYFSSIGIATRPETIGITFSGNPISHEMGLGQIAFYESIDHKIAIGGAPSDGYSEGNLDPKHKAFWNKLQDKKYREFARYKSGYEVRASDESAPSHVFNKESERNEKFKELVLDIAHYRSHAH